jgi:hypothetical protein
MLHACFTPIVLCFIYTSWHFYAFYGTNLLTTCHSASSYFLLFFYSRFLPKEIFSELDETKPEVPIFLSCTRSPKQRRRGARGWPHHRVARVTPWPRHQVVWAPWPPSDITLPPINSLRRENPKGIDIRPWKRIRSIWFGIQNFGITFQQIGRCWEPIFCQHQNELTFQQKIGNSFQFINFRSKRQCKSTYIESIPFSHACNAHTIFFTNFHITMSISCIL